jgi:hypothetical protein
VVGLPLAWGHELLQDRWRPPLQVNDHRKLVARVEATALGTRTSLRDRLHSRAR